MKKVVLSLLFILVSSYLFGQSAITPPTNLTATQITVSNTFPAVKLTWSPSTTANVKYAVYRKQAALNDTTQRYYLIMSTFRDTTFTNSYVTPGTTYTYYVVAYTNASVSSEPSNKVEIAVTSPVISRGW